MTTPMTAYGWSPVLIRSRRIGLVNGVFDLFHSGHRRFLWEASKFCDYLVVAVNDDASVKRLKGPSRPFDNLHYRMDRVSEYADMTVPFNGNLLDLEFSFHPHVLIRGWDQHSDWWKRSLGVIVFLPPFGDVSTTGIATCGTGSRVSSVTTDGPSTASSRSSSSSASPSATRPVLEKSTSEQDRLSVLKAMDQCWVCSSERL